MIQPSTAAAIRRDHAAGYGIQQIAKDRGLTCDEVRRVVYAEDHRLSPLERAKRELKREGYSDAVIDANF